MALKQLMLNKKIEQRKASLATLNETEKELKKREADLEASIDEAQTEEETTTIEEEADKLEKEKEDLTEKKSKLEGEIAELEGELEKLNANEPQDEEETKRSNEKLNKREGGTMKRYKFFNGMTREAVNALVNREEVKDFLSRTKEFIKQKRAVTGGELGVPDIILEMLRDTLNQYSKLIKHVNLKPVHGTARQTIVGTVNEAIWTEMIAKINELEIVFNQLEVDGYKVGGYVPVPNSLLQDSEDINLLNEIMVYLGQSIGLAIDKAILYGTGIKMPVGIVTRLAETAKPAYWGTKEKAWTDLHTTNLLVIDPAAADEKVFYQDLIRKLGRAKANYSNGEKFWSMSSNTFAELQAKALMFNAAGAIVSGQNGTMPVIGGVVETLDFIPDGTIIGGYGSIYLLAERAGASLAQSEHVQFIEDNTVFKGTARYDGRPVFGEAFVAININQEAGATAPTATAVTFAADTANG